MPAPAQYTYSPAAKVAAHTAFRDLLDAHATLPASVRIRDAADTLLGEIPVAKPSGAVNGGTGQFVADIDPIPRDEGATAGGTAAYGELCDGAGVVHLALPCQEGVVPLPGKLVLRALTVDAGAPIELVSLTVG